MHTTNGFTLKEQLLLRPTAATTDFAVPSSTHLEPTQLEPNFSAVVQKLNTASEVSAEKVGFTPERPPMTLPTSRCDLSLLVLPRTRGLARGFPLCCTACSARGVAALPVSAHVGGFPRVRGETALWFHQGVSSWRSLLDHVYGFRRSGDHSAAPKDNGLLEEEPSSGHMQLWTETGPHGSPTDGAGSPHDITDQDAQQKLISAGLLSKDPWKWSYTRWDADKQTHCPTEEEPLLHLP